MINRRLIGLLFSASCAMVLTACSDHGDSVTAIEAAAQKSSQNAVESSEEANILADNVTAGNDQPSVLAETANTEEDVQEDETQETAVVEEQEEVSTDTQQALDVDESMSTEAEESTQAAVEEATELMDEIAVE